jgi:hypothetical protein
MRNCRKCRQVGSALFRAGRRTDGNGEAIVLTNALEWRCQEVDDVLINSIRDGLINCADWTELWDDGEWLWDVIEGGEGE